MSTYDPICAECVEETQDLAPRIVNGRRVLLCKLCRDGESLRGKPAAKSVRQGGRPGRGMGDGNFRRRTGIRGR